MSETTRGVEYTTESVLYLALELGDAKWKLGFSIGLGQKPRRRTIEGRDLPALRREIAAAKVRFRLADGARVRRSYEAGREGFWLHRYLAAEEIKNLVVDLSSIEVSRRARRAKTDKLDVGKLLTMLMRYYLGEDKLWSVVHVPTVEAEDMRHLHRQLTTLKKDRTRHRCRISGLLACQGVRVPESADFLERLDSVRIWDGSGLAPGLRTRLQREHKALQYVEEQIREVEAERQQLLDSSRHPCVQKVRALLKLRGIGPNSSWLFVMEFSGWRNFRNRREVGALAGLTPTPYQSGAELREQGISKAGNRPLRGMAIEIAWAWVR